MNNSDDININFLIEDKNDLVYDKEINNILSGIDEKKSVMSSITNSPTYECLFKAVSNDICYNDDVSLDVRCSSKFHPSDIFQLPYYTIKYQYHGDDFFFYDNQYTVKGLMKICEYYKIDKNVKSSKCKKQDIIDTIILFESLDENQEIVFKRHQMWAYMDFISKDKSMRKYIYWD